MANWWNSKLFCLGIRRSADPTKGKERRYQITSSSVECSRTSSKEKASRSRQLHAPSATVDKFDYRWLPSDGLLGSELAPGTGKRGRNRILFFAGTTEEKIKVMIGHKKILLYPWPPAPYDWSRYTYVCRLGTQCPVPTLCSMWVRWDAGYHLSLVSGMFGWSGGPGRQLGWKLEAAWRSIA